MNNNTTMTIDEVAAMHRVSRRTIERWIAAGSLPVSKLPGGLVRITKTDAESILKPSAIESLGAGRASFEYSFDSAVHDGTAS